MSHSHHISRNNQWYRYAFQIINRCSGKSLTFGAFPGFIIFKAAAVSALQSYRMVTIRRLKRYSQTKTISTKSVGELYTTYIVLLWRKLNYRSSFHCLKNLKMYSKEHLLGYLHFDNTQMVILNSIPVIIFLCEVFMTGVFDLSILRHCFRIVFSIYYCKQQV